jgi:hypothetical protein
MESKSRGVLNTPLEPVIGLAEGETRWRGMTVSFGASHHCQFGADLSYNASSTALAISAVPLLPPNSIGLMPSA